MMTVSVEVKTRLVDVLAGILMPKDPLILNAIVLARSPGPDGLLYEATDVISPRMTSISFVVDNHRMLSAAATIFPLVESDPSEVFLLLMQAGGEPYAFGRIRTADGQPASRCIEAPKGRVEIQYQRNLG